MFFCVGSENMGFTAPTLIQQSAIPLILKGRDVYPPDSLQVFFCNGQMMDLSNLLSVLKAFSRHRHIGRTRGLFSEVGESLHLECVKQLRGSLSKPS